MRWAAAAVAGAAVFALVLALHPAAALAGWRAAFLAVSAVPLGAVTLLLIARLTGADWGAALLPLAGRMWMLLPAFLPVVAGQALAARPAHLATWLAWPFFLVRGGIAIGVWWWLARALARGGPSPLWSGLALVAHGVLLTVVGTDWLLGTSPGQPNSATAMILTASAVLAAAAAACLLGTGTERMRRDLSFLLVAAALGLAYLLFMDFLIVWFGNLPTRVGWYAGRRAWPWVMLPLLALAAGLAVPVAGVGLLRSERGRAAAGLGALVGLACVMAWEAGPPSAWALPAAAAALVLAGALAPRRQA